MRDIYILLNGEPRPYDTTDFKALGKEIDLKQIIAYDEAQWDNLDVMKKLALSIIRIKFDILFGNIKVHKIVISNLKLGLQT